MGKRQIITIAGRPASGKSTASKSVAKMLGFDHFSSGDLFRQIAAERGIDVLEANLTAEQNSEIDDMVDGRLQEIGKTGDGVVIDSRLAWHWMPESFRVFLNLDLETAAERVLADKSKRKLANEHIPNDPVEYAMVLQSRLDSEARRYKKLYDINPYEISNYDLVIDTSSNSPEKVIDSIISSYNSWLAETSS